MSAARSRRPGATSWPTVGRGGRVSGFVQTMTAPELREARVRATVLGEVDRDLHLAAVEALSEILVVVAGSAHLWDDDRADAVDDAADLAEVLRGAAKSIVGREKDHDKEVERLEARVSENEQRLGEARDDADARLRDMAKDLDSARARADLAEHNLAEATRLGHALDAERADRERDQARTIALLATALLDGPTEESALAAAAVLERSPEGALARVERGPRGIWGRRVSLQRMRALQSRLRRENGILAEMLVAARDRAPLRRRGQ